MQNAYELLNNFNAVSVYNSKGRVAGACLGMPAIVPRRIHYRDLGYMFDADSLEGISDF